MARRKLLMLFKPFDAYPVLESGSLSRITNPQMLRYLESRCKVHKNAINFCQDILRSKPVEWEAISRNNLSQPIRDVDLVVTVGGDGTLLQASHFMDDSVPVLGVNSDPTQVKEMHSNWGSLLSYCMVRWKSSTMSLMLLEVQATFAQQPSTTSNKY